MSETPRVQAMMDDCDAQRGLVKAIAAAGAVEKGGDK